MVKLKILPLSNESVEERVAAFRQYNDEVRLSQCNNWIFFIIADHYNSGLLKTKLFTYVNLCRHNHQSLLLEKSNAYLFVGYIFCDCIAEILCFLAFIVTYL